MRGLIVIWVLAAVTVFLNLPRETPTRATRDASSDAREVEGIDLGSVVAGLSARGVSELASEQRDACADRLRDLDNQAGRRFTSADELPGREVSPRGDRSATCCPLAWLIACSGNGALLADFSSRDHHSCGSTLDAHEGFERWLSKNGLRSEEVASIQGPRFRTCPATPDQPGPAPAPPAIVPTPSVPSTPVLECPVPPAGRPRVAASSRTRR